MCWYPLGREESTAYSRSPEKSSGNKKVSGSNKERISSGTSPDRLEIPWSFNSLRMAVAEEKMAGSIEGSWYPLPFLAMVTGMIELPALIRALQYSTPKRLLGDASMEWSEKE